MASTRTKKRIATAIAVLGVLAGVAYCVDVGQVGQQKAEQARRELEAARSVSVLPPGTEEAWLAYVDRRIAATMKREGSTVQVIPFGGLGIIPPPEITYISINNPYKINCMAGASVDFGTGETVLIYNFVLGPIGKEEPALGVDPQSIAAKKLNEALCRKVSDRVQAIMSPDR